MTPKRVLFPLAFSFCLSVLATSNIRAATLAEDSFNTYETGSLVGRDGGSGWAGPWQMGAGNTATVIDTGVAPLLFEPENATPLEGGERALELRGTGNQITVTRQLAAPRTEAFYLSYLLRVSAGSWTDTDTFGVHLGSNTTSTATLNIGSRGVDAGGGVFMTRTGTGAPVPGAFFNGIVDVGQVNYLVARVSKLDEAGNATTTFDRVDVWLNPGLDANSTDPDGHFRVQLAGGSGLEAISHLLVRIAALEAADAIQVDQLHLSTDWPVIVSPLPRIQNLSPANRSTYVNAAEGIRFIAASDEPLTAANISLKVNGADVSSALQISGTGDMREVAYLSLRSNTLYTAEITVTNSFGPVSRTIQFDTFAEDNLVVEAEDFNFGGGQFYDDPVLCNDPGGSPANCYFDRVGTQGIDANETSGASDNTAPANYLELYRWGPDFVERGENVDTFTTQDSVRPKFTEAPPGAQGQIKDFDVTQIAAGDWLNYTRTFPNGTFALYLRARSSAPQQVTLNRVASPASANQTATVIGGFNVPNTGGAYAYVPLTTAAGDILPVKLSGVETLRLTASEASNNMQWNYLLLAPSEASAAPAFIASATPSEGAINVPPDSAINVEISNAATSARSDTIQLTVDGADVTSKAAISPSASGVTVRYAPGILLPGEHIVSIQFQDTTGTLVRQEWQFAVANLPLLPSAWAAPVGSGANRGFNVRSVQVLDPDVAAALPRALARVEDQLAGVIQADHTGTDTPSVINYKERSDIGDQGYFTSNNGFPDNVAQDLGLLSFDNHEHFAVEATFFLELTPGVVRIGANVNDTFRLNAGPGGESAADYPLLIGEWAGEGAATGAQPQYPATFVVTKAGVYAFRFVWAEYVGSSSAELHVKDVEGDSHLLNDDQLVNGKPSPIRAYRTRTQEPPQEAATLSIARGANGAVTIGWTGAGTLQSAMAITGPWTPVAPQANPYSTTPQGNTFFRVVN